MSARLTFEKAQERLGELSSGRFRLVEFVKSSGPCRVEDTTTGEQYSYCSFDALRSTLKKNRNNTLLSQKSRKSRILELSRGAYELASSGSKAQEPCVLKDVTTGEYIDCCAFSFVQNALSKNPDHKFVAKNPHKTIEELSNGRFTLIEYTKASDNCTLLDTTDGQEFSIIYDRARVALLSNSSHEFPLAKKVATPEELVNSLSEGRYTLTKYNGARGRSTIVDTKTGALYERMHAHIVNTLSNHPDYEFGDNTTSIELVVEGFLKELGVNYAYDKPCAGVRPDFLIEAHKLVIECDGLYWHSDAVIPSPSHHKQRRTKYLEAGYRPLFFREDEILGKPTIIKSIIRNKLGLSSKIYARKCKIVEGTSSTFFEDNHLMGKGSGVCYSLVYEDTVVASIQVRWIDKSRKILDIARFCGIIDFTIVGGFSKLLSHVIKAMSPHEIVNFVDLRYGSGDHLASLGFKLSNTSLSFKWAGAQQSYPRMRYPGKTGYDYGLVRVWDCGQAKFTKECRG